MKEEDSNWFSKWEEELPLPEELTPLSQSLITPDLALAFNIPPPMPSNQSLRRTTPPPPPPTSQPNSSAEFDSPELSGAATGTGSDEPARTLKRPRLVWTPQLHKRFVDAVAHLGIKNAVPKTIMQLMSVDGLTRENVASHLQKYRLYLKRMQGISGSGTGTGIPESATDHLFASAPVPAHFLHPNRTNSDHFFAAMPAPHQMAIVGAPPPPQAAHHHHPQLRQHFGSSPQFETHPYIRQSQQRLHPVGGGYVEDLESGNGGGNGRKVLTLFPTGND